MMRCRNSLFDDDWFTCQKLTICYYQDVSGMFNFFSLYLYALPVWGTAIHKTLSRLTRLYNRGIRLSCGLRKYDHVT